MSFTAIRKYPYSKTELFYNQYLSTQSINTEYIGVKEMSLWIKSPCDTGTAAVNFIKEIVTDKEILYAYIEVSAIGVYELTVNGEKVGNRVLTPGFTGYHNRVQYQKYDVTSLLKKKSTVGIVVANGWAVGHFGFVGKRQLYSDHTSAYARLHIEYADGSNEDIYTDTSWEVYTHEVTFADIYDGETVDKTHIPTFLGNAALDDKKYNLVEDIGEPICEQETLFPTLIVTPNGERILDFSQNMTGYVSLNIKGNKGEKVRLSFAEVLDKDGNFYNENYRLAENKVTYILSGNEDYFRPRFSFRGFRYVRIDEYPNEDIDVSGFKAIVVHSDMRRIGNFTCANDKINQLYHNIIWGQKSNYLDIPTDCPQRNERLGWTGDAQVFIKTAGINYDVRKFFDKWLADLRAEQGENGAIYGTCPEVDGMHRNPHSRISAGWGDVATVAPWTLYELYGDKKILEDNFEMMRRWVEYMHSAGSEEYLWLGGFHYGDWLAMDAGGDTYEGATSKDLIASAYFAYSTKFLIKAGEVLGKDMSEYKELYNNILSAFRSRFMKDGLPIEKTPPEGSRNTVRSGMTQTAISIILKFELCKEEERQGLADKLEELIHAFGDKMSTGFLGTPYILHALSENGKAELAYKLLFNEESPSWLYSVNHGATTMWEHWNGIKEDGSFWSNDMNSFNHYAYGAVGDWLYGAVAGIKVDEAGYKRVTLAPKPDKRLKFVNCSVDTPYGYLESNWYCRDEHVCFEFSVPPKMSATVVLPNGSQYTVGSGRYNFTM